MMEEKEFKKAVNQALERFEKEIGFGKIIQTAVGETVVAEEYFFGVPEKEIVVLKGKEFLKDKWRKVKIYCLLEKDEKSYYLHVANLALLENEAI